MSGKALTLMGMGRPELAQSVLRDALELNPWLPERRYLVEEPGQMRSAASHRQHDRDRSVDRRAAWVGGAPTAELPKSIGLQGKGQRVYCENGRAHDYDVEHGHKLRV